MNSGTDENPYSALSAVPPPLPVLNPGFSAPSIVMLVVAWLLWSLLFLSWPVDALIAALQPPRAAAEPHRHLVAVFGFISVVQLALTLFFRWLFFTFLIHPKRLRPGSWPASGVGILGMLFIYSGLKSVETYGFILLLSTHSWPHYLAFAVPAFIFFILMIPAWLLRAKVPADGAIG